MTVTGRFDSDGLGPSNAAAAPRALLLIVVAVIIGLVLLWKGLDTTPGIAVPQEGAEDGLTEPVSMAEDSPVDLVMADEPVVTTTVVPPTTTTTVAPAPTRPPNQV